MPVGLRLAPENVDLERFKQFVVIGEGGVLGDPCTKSGEVVRFHVGRHLGRVSKRKNGLLTFSGVARSLLLKMQGADRIESHRHEQNQQGDNANV